MNITSFHVPFILRLKLKVIYHNIDILTIKGKSLVKEHGITNLVP